MSASALPTAEPAPGRQTSVVQRWLLACCERVSGGQALLVVQQGNQVKPLACVPTSQGVDQVLLQVARRALKEKRVLVRAEQQQAQQEACIGFSMRVAGRPGAVVFRLAISPLEDEATVLKRIGALTLRRAEDQPNQDEDASETNSAASVALQSKVAVPPLAKNTATPTPAVMPDGVSALVAEQGTLLGSIAALVDQPNLDQSLYALACRTAQQYRCLRVYIGCVVGEKIVIRAVSGLVDFDPRSALMVDVVEAMNETRLLAHTIQVPDDSAEPVPPQSHASLAEQLNNPALISIPMAVDDSVVGVLLLERDRAFDAREALQLERLSLFISPMLALKTTEAMSAWQWLRRFCVRGLRGVFGPTRIGLKLSLLSLVLLVAASSIYTQMHTVDADASLEPRTQRAVVSGFASFLSQAEARAGDIVQSGDVLARLDVDELALDRIKWLGERDKLDKEYRANLAQRDRSKVRVLEAQRSQAQAKIDLIDAQIERGTLRAPIDGVVVSGDHFQSLGRPVERGELLFEVASLDDFRLILRLDEQDIGWVQLGSKGQLRLRSLTDRTFPFEVTAVTPVSEPGEGANTFRVEANLEKLPASMRPGMQGVAKIEVQQRAIGWIWTRSFVDWVRMQAWKFGGF